MNPFGLTASGLLLWGILAHLVGDWGLQSAWMAKNKALRRRRRDVAREMQGGTPRWLPGPWWDRHPAAYAHAGVHGVLLAPVLGWPAVVVAAAHLVIDTRSLVEWWSRLIRQDQPSWRQFVEAWAADPEHRPYSMNFDDLAMKTRVEGADRVMDQVNEARRRLEKLTISGPGSEVATQREVDTAVREVRAEASEATEKLMADMREWSSEVGYSMGHEVRVWLDQTFHFVTLAAAAVLVAAL